MLESINREAAKRTAKTVAKALAIAVGIPLALFVLPWSALITILIIAALAVVIYTVYSVHLNQVKYDERWGDSRFK
jgi:uncharacterized membrane protein YoaK (UPF0700 family)